MSDGAPVLALERVSKSFGAVQALQDVDFEVRPGEVVALVGDNGAGKSTLVKAIAGIHSVDGGEILFEGRPVQGRHAHRRGRPGDRDRLPGPRAVRQPRRRREPLPRSRGARRRARDDHPPARRDGDGAPGPRAARQPRGDDHRRALGGRHDVRRPAPAGGDRALAARRAEGGAARRADGGARRAPDRAGPGADQAAAREGPRRGRDQPQPRRRVRGRRPDRGAAARAAGRDLRREADEHEEVVGAITGASDPSTGELGPAVDDVMRAARSRDRPGETPDGEAEERGTGGGA